MTDRYQPFVQQAHDLINDHENQGVSEGYDYSNLAGKTDAELSKLAQERSDGSQWKYTDELMYLKSERDKANKAAALGKQGVAEGSTVLSIQQLATISDEALDNAYHYGRSTPGNTFGWQANLKSAAYAKQMIDKGVTDIEAISDAIHKGWNTTAQAFVKNPDQFSDTEKLKAAGKLEAKLQQRAQLMKQNYAQLPEEEKEKDRVVARALLQAIKGEQGVAEDTELAKEFDLIERIIEDIAEHNGVDAEVIWEDLETLDDDELYVFATTTTIMETEAWQKANNRDKTDGMSRKAVKTYRREHPGSKLQTAVTTKPSKLKKGSKASKRRKSYCSRSRGQMKMHNISCAKTPDKAICKARRRWNC
jgi:anti-sigma regulatory factor (Ser/Thr protein kinase)